MMTLLEEIVPTVIAGRIKVGIYRPRKPELGDTELAITFTGRDGQLHGQSVLLRRAQLAAVVSQLETALAVIDGERDAERSPSAPTEGDAQARPRVASRQPAVQGAPAADARERRATHGWDAQAIAARWKEH